MGILSTSFIPSALWLGFQHLQVPSHLSGAPEDARGKAPFSEVSFSGLGGPRAAHTARATIQSISSAKLEGPCKVLIF